MSEQTFFIVPRGNPGLAPLQLNMRNVQQAEERLGEIALLNAQKAPELLVLFNRAFLDIVQMLSALELEKVSAARCVNTRRSLLMTDIVPRLLKEKGLRDSQDIREALIDGDLEYQELRERQGAILAYETLLEGKKKSVEMSYSSVKRIIDRTSVMGMGYVNPNVHGPAQSARVLEPGQNAQLPPARLPAPNPQEEQKDPYEQPTRRFGKPNYRMG